tara:strand:+ start:9805 stop:10221 length:417 start_codon:yes stop_codon:yes gene_type:complete
VKAENTVFEMNFVVFPQHTNYMPPMIFGGKLAAEMDICAAMTARRALYKSEDCVDAITVNMGGRKGPGINFYHAAKVKDLIFLRGEIVRFGIKSIDVMVTGKLEGPTGEVHKLCEGLFTFVSRNKDGTPTRHNLTLEE